MEVLILKTDKRLGIKAGEIYAGYGYQMDPSKIVLDHRLPDGYDPCCAQYKHEVAIKIKGTWCKVVNNQYTIMSEKELKRISPNKALT